MALSLYAAAIPVTDRALENLEHVLRKGEADAAERGIDAEIFLTARLAPDMFNLIQQVQVAASMAKNLPHRLAGTQAPVYEDTETTFADLYALIAKARAEIGGFTPEQLNGREDISFKVPLGPMEPEFTAQTYLAGFSLPNIYFHCTTAYNILRMNGVKLIKFDFFGGGMP